MNIHEYRADKIIHWLAGRPVSISAAYRQLRSPCAARMLFGRLGVPAAHTKADPAVALHAARWTRN